EARGHGSEAYPGAAQPSLGCGWQAEKPPKRKIRPATAPPFVVSTTQRDESS
ncbi:MAG: hypothetical protein IM613_18075, partial [Cytophagales bacterium]|nr:hypothetical protein [Cytophagales bacterium]